MGSLKQKVNKAIASKEAIRQAIIAKNVDVPEATPLADYAGKVEQIKAGGGGFVPDDNTSFGYSTWEVFPSNIDLSKKTQYYQFLRGSSTLKTFSRKDMPSIVGDISRMFYDCTGLTKVEMPDLQYTNGGSCRSMFHNCKNLDAITFDLGAPNFYADDIFYECTALKSIKKINLSKVSNCNLILKRCNILTYAFIDEIGTRNAFDTIDLAGAPNWGNEEMAATQGITGAFESLKKSLLDNSFDRATAEYAPATIRLDKAIEGRLNTADPTLIGQIQAKGYTLTF